MIKKLRESEDRLNNTEDVSYPLLTCRNNTIELPLFEKKKKVGVDIGVGKSKLLAEYQKRVKENNQDRRLLNIREAFQVQKTNYFGSDGKISSHMKVKEEKSESKSET